ncbi:Transmembrane adaptor Erv26 [Novymonas esmeraldas]|uniref:Transmembrane adaptor Erv26 n=1 Tax=Novymonas esmeraldas TaxID=1808958 RepID=A0AAW0EP41_9TRYP
MERSRFSYLNDDGEGDWWRRPRRAYRSFGPFRIVSTLMVAVAIGFVAFGLACAIMFVADLAEEHPSRARWVLRALVVFNLIVHVSIMAVDQMSWWRSLLSITVNALYLRLLRTFPFVPSMSSPLMLTTVIAVLLESAMWYWLAVRLMYYTSVMLIIGFFLMLWLVPIGLLSSCVLEDDRLPGGGAGSPYGSGTRSAEPVTSGRRQRTILNRLADLIGRS